MSAKVEKALLIASRGDGPWMPVIGLEEIEVEGLERDDRIVVESDYETCVELTEDGVHSVNVLDGKIRIVRAIGDSRVTVRARCER